MTRYLGALSGLARGLALTAVACGLGGCAWLGLADAPGEGREPPRPPSPAAPAPEDIAAAKTRWAEEALPTLDLTRYEAMRLFFAQAPDGPPALDDATLRRLGALVMAELDRLAPDRPPLAGKLAPGQGAYDATVLCERVQIESGPAAGGQRGEPAARPGASGPGTADRRPDGQGGAPGKTVLSAMITLSDAASGQSLAAFRVEKVLEPGEPVGLGPTPTEDWRRFARGMAAAVLGRPGLAGLSTGMAADAP